MNGVQIIAGVDTFALLVHRVKHRIRVQKDIIVSQAVAAKQNALVDAMEMLIYKVIHHAVVLVRRATTAHQVRQVPRKFSVLEDTIVQRGQQAQHDAQQVLGFLLLGRSV